MKISQMIIDLASDYIERGATLEEKQNYLNVACVAWNISILPESVRKPALTAFLTNYKKNNPDDDEENIKNIERDLELLIREKIRMFSYAVTPIEHATIREDDNEYRIIIASSARTDQPPTTDHSANSTLTKH
jgi:hypothetical protein